MIVAGSHIWVSEFVAVGVMVNGAGAVVVAAELSVEVGSCVNVGV